MVQMTMQVSEELGTRLRPIGRWLPTVLEFSLVGFKTLATATTTEGIEFLSTELTRQDVLNYHVSEQVQARLQRFLALNAAGMLGEAEQQELDELQCIEHSIIMLVGAHPDLASMLAEHPFLDWVGNRHQFHLGLVITYDNHLLTLFHQSDQFEEMTFCLLYGNDFRRHSSHHS